MKRINCLKCGKKISGKNPKKKYCSKKCRYLASRKDGNKYIGVNGYVYIKLNRKYYLEHRIIMKEILGRKLKIDEQIHHKNHIKTDNRPKNLRLFDSNANHVQFHYNSKVINSPQSIAKRIKTRWGNLPKYCSIKNCKRKRKARGLCGTHYEQERRINNLQNFSLLLL